ncbi:DNA adenine methylase [Corynebacterium hansenii]|uniref:site-specific DNA-methyltransferase (adenine-specific) n=1 Tax=Corynebacterium hansenii TaxID=394964 RepID=A0ABV7ZMQ3_9CORY|nr:DNA adenine methylase [Corynebacterium hansenii]WJY99391.1 Modification methylase FokI [Corynebacterium hansenii]
MGVRYIGSKARVADAIVDLAGDPRGGRFIDAFSGTGAVAAAAASRGWNVSVNDALPSAVAMSIGATVGQGNVPFVGLGGYNNAVNKLNAVTAKPGFLHSEYSPASALTGEVERRYFTEHNAARLDSMRAQIATWAAAGRLSNLEEELLIADLLQAANSVANISGTYGCFLKDWSSTALRPVQVRARELPRRTTDLRASVGDVTSVATTINDTVYLDPPYTKRQYSAYYHILETIHAGDSPVVGGVTGLRPWKDKASDYCYKTRALDALTRLVRGTNARRILLSYSNEGHVPREQLLNAMSGVGQVTLHDIKTIGRYRPNARASAKADTVEEYVIEVQPTPLTQQAGNNQRSTVRA